MEVGIVRRVDIDRQMQEAYLDYAMSVIVSRALPDVRDGLKPVHRRILYAMYDMRLFANQPYKKSARIVGEVLGKYHPHGDAAVYDAMVRMAQDFSMRAPLVDGQGNFGSVDGDPAAAMRYTEARMSPVAHEMLADIDKDTVDFTDNFDGSLVEPTVLPARLPNLLVNGASGIAVGMATSIPPHNLGEVCDALSFMIDRALKNEDVTIDELMKFIKGPDFPTGGIVYRYADTKNGDAPEDVIQNAYAVGRGRITVQARVHVEEMSRNRHRLVITELPYQTNKANLTEKIADLARDGKIEGIADLRDESDRQGMRLVIELTRTVDPMEVLKQLFKMTPLQATFSINMLALVDGEPRLLSLKRALQLFIKHRKDIITRRTRYDLNQAQNRAHILEGLRIALANLDEVIAIIRKSRTSDTAKKNLCTRFKLTVVQATAILDMPLRRLAALERKKIELEYKEVLQRIKYLEGLLKSPRKILGVIKEELKDIKEKYDTPRRTLIVDQPVDKNQPITTDELVPDEAVIAAVSESGYLCHWPADQALEPARGRRKDNLRLAAAVQTRDVLCLLTDTGRAALIPMHQVPAGEAPGDGAPLREFNLQASETPVAGLALPKNGELKGFLFLVSRLGRVKRISLEDLAAVRGTETVVMGLDEDDALLTGFVTPGDGEVVLVSAKGQAIRFAEENVRPMGLPAAGVMGIKLADDDYLAGAGPVKPRGDLVLATAQGLGKRTSLDEFPTQGRYGQGVIAIKLKDDEVVCAETATASDRVMLITDKGNNKTVYVRSLPKLGRSSQGKALIAVRGKDRLVRLVVLPA